MVKICQIPAILRRFWPKGKVHGEPWGPINLHLAARLGRMQELQEVGTPGTPGAGDVKSRVF